jgi:hypothetical protein
MSRERHAALITLAVVEAMERGKDRPEDAA